MRFEAEGRSRTRIWNLNAELRRILEPIAAEFGWTVEDFLTRYSNGGLPGQLPHRSFDDEELVPPPPEFTAEPFASDPEIWRRIQRAAEFYEQSAAELIWGAVWGDVRCREDDMIVSPRDGRLIGDDLEIGKFELRG